MKDKATTIKSMKKKMKAEGFSSLEITKEGKLVCACHIDEDFITCYDFECLCLKGNRTLKEVRAFVDTHCPDNNSPSN